jgi:putative endonuclease
MTRQYYTYIMANSKGTLYTGMTNNIRKRVWQHKNKLADSFTRQHNITKLVWYYAFNTPMEAIQMEKRIKGWTRDKKIALIRSVNACWMDLSENWFRPPVPAGVRDSSLCSE